MAERVEVDVIVEAITRGFNDLKKELKAVGTETKKAGDAAKGAGAGATSGFKQFTDGAKKAKEAIGGLTVGVVAAVATLKKAYDLLSEGAQLQRTKQQFDALTASIGSSSDAMLTALQAATGGMQSNAALMSSAGQIISLGLADTEDGVVRLANLVSQLGWDMQQVIMTFANNSKMRLDALGLSVEDVTNKAKELEKQGYSTDAAFDMAVIEAGEEKLKLLGSAAGTTAGDLQVLTAELQNLKNAALEAWAAMIGPSIGAISGRHGDTVAGMIEDSLSDMETMEQLIAKAQQISDKLSMGGGLAAVFTGAEAGLLTGMQATIEKMAQMAGSAEELGAAIDEAFTGRGRQAAAAFINEMGGLEEVFSAAQRRGLDEYTASLEELAQAGRAAAISQREIAPSRAFSEQARAELNAYVNDLEKLAQIGRAGMANIDYGNMAEQATRYAAALVMVERGLKKVNQAAISIAATQQANADMFGGIDIDAESLGSVYGDAVPYIQDYTEKIEELQGKLDPLNEKLADGDDLTTKQAESYAEITAELEKLNAAQGQQAMAWVPDEEMAAGVEAMIDTAAEAGATAQALYTLAGGTEAAAEALKNMAVQAKAIELGKAIAEGLDPGVAMAELQAFIDGFDLEALFQESRRGGAEVAKSMKEIMLEEVEGITTGAATAVSEATAPAFTSITNLNNAISEIPEETNTSFVTNADEVINNDVANLTTALDDLTRAPHIITLQIQTIGEIPTIPGVPAEMIPGHAAGGPVTAGQPYIVGEMGPELFVPGASGYIVPNHKLPSAGGGPGVNGGAPPFVYININGTGKSPQATAAEIQYQISRFGYSTR